MRASLEELPTPAPLVDLARLRRNAEAMLDRARAWGVRLRPHVKTHKCPEIGRLQHGGRIGPVTVSTLAEAEGFALAGFQDLTYAVPIEPGKFARAFALARRVRLQLVSDDADAASALASASERAGLRVPVFVEIDCGDRRCGVDPEAPVAAELARRIAESPSLELAGILTHAGHAYDARGADEIGRIARQECETSVRFAGRLRAEGIPVPEISLGSTPTMTHAEDLPGATEIRPGNYVFFDAFQAVRGSCGWNDCALTVLAAVVHRDSARVVVDAGAIALSKDLGPAREDSRAGYGRVLDRNGADTGLRVARVSQEHGEIDLPPGADPSAFPVGSRLRILVNHACLTAAQHAGYWVLEKEAAVDFWPVVRGW
jgi:D-serine deaminase-like pyridoxal phosphate-dependent protein